MTGDPGKINPEKPAADAGKGKETTETEARANAARRQGAFRADMLAGGAVNTFRIEEPANRVTEVSATVTWPGTDRFRLGCPEAKKDTAATKSDTSDASKAGSGNATPQIYPATSKAPEGVSQTSTLIGIFIPTPPCWSPPAQSGDITIVGNIEGFSGPQTLFKGRMPVSGLWFPLLVTAVFVGAIYPGSAAAAWYVSVRRYRDEVNKAKPGDPIKEGPRFWRSLNPVELTKNAYGRASIAKLQIFAFTFIVFTLLLFHVLRTGLLANISTDVLLLMGISGAGAIAGKVAFVSRRRLSMENWAWLRRKGWLPPDKDRQPYAKWSELLVDNGTKEFDPYRFQMAIFSLVVAIALITASATGLEAFKIPQEMLILLGLSQTVFVAGQAMENGGFAELDQKLTEVQKLARSVQELAQKAEAAKAEAVKAEAAKAGAAQPDAAKPDAAKPDAAKPDAAKPDAAGAIVPKTAAEIAAEAERVKYEAALAQAAEMFAAVYGEQLGDTLPAPVLEARNMQVG